MLLLSSPSLLFFFLFCLCFCSLCLSTTVTISNSLPRRDSVSGAILDAHDSKVRYNKADRSYYWYAASYGECEEPANTDNGCANINVGACGFLTNHTVTLYTSPDLSTWTNRGVVFEAANALPNNSVLFAPKTIYNDNTKQWVMWFNYIVASFDKSYYGVAVSSSAFGPFKVAVSNVATLVYQDNGDENLFVDDDGTAYLIYTSIAQGHAMSIERLTPDYLGTVGSSGSSGLFGSSFVEAPLMFKRGSIYYTLFGSCCCYCGAGSSVDVYTAESALGPYTKRTNLGDLHSQSTDAFIYYDEAGETQVMYVGDHWQSAPDGLKAHDYTVWAPIIFDDTGLIVTTKGFQNNFTITVNTA